ncbi:UNVERIFIED_CONTAM: hypothetical protein HHA_453960 [Hammondia hammondi]|eukprot:XP_008887327.1 hypothetical protein HHA_453960 [Hammondia hammondi]
MKTVSKNRRTLSAASRGSHGHSLSDAPQRHAEREEGDSREGDGEPVACAEADLLTAASLHFPEWLWGVDAHRERRDAARAFSPLGSHQGVSELRAQRRGKRGGSAGCRHTEGSTSRGTDDGGGRRAGFPRKLHRRLTPGPVHAAEGEASATRGTPCSVSLSGEVSVLRHPLGGPPLSPACPLSPRSSLSSSSSSLPTEAVSGEVQEPTDAGRECGSGVRSSSASLSCDIDGSAGGAAAGRLASPLSSKAPDPLFSSVVSLSLSEVSCHPSSLPQASSAFSFVPSSGPSSAPRPDPWSSSGSPASSVRQGSMSSSLRVPPSVAGGDRFPPALAPSSSFPAGPHARHAERKTHAKIHVLQSSRCQYRQRTHSLAALAARGFFLFGALCVTPEQVQHRRATHWRHAHFPFLFLSDDEGRRGGGSRGESEEDAASSGGEEEAGEGVQGGGRGRGGAREREEGGVQAEEVVETLDAVASVPVHDEKRDAKLPLHFRLWRAFCSRRTLETNWRERLRRDAEARRKTDEEQGRRRSWKKSKREERNVSDGGSHVAKSRRHGKSSAQRVPHDSARRDTSEDCEDCEDCGEEEDGRRLTRSASATPSDSEVSGLSGVAGVSAHATTAVPPHPLVFLGLHEGLDVLLQRILEGSYKHPNCRPPGCVGIHAYTPGISEAQFQAWLRQKLQDRVLGMEDVYNDEELRMDLQKRLLEVTFVQSGVLPLLFESVILGRSRESSVSLLSAVVHHAHPGKALSVFREEISAACLPWVSRLADLLYSSLPKSRGSHASGKVNTPPRRLGCRVVELLELFRGIVELSPASVLPRVSLKVWRRLTDCFFVYTKNTIFMSKCLPVFKKVADHGSSLLQRQVFVQCRLLERLDAAVSSFRRRLHKNANTTEGLGAIMDLLVHLNHFYRTSAETLGLSEDVPALSSSSSSVSSTPTPTHHGSALALSPGGRLLHATSFSALPLLSSAASTPAFVSPSASPLASSSLSPALSCASYPPQPILALHPVPPTVDEPVVLSPPAPMMRMAAAANFAGAPESPLPGSPRHPSLSFLGSRKSSGESWRPPSPALSSSVSIDALAGLDGDSPPPQGPPQRAGGEAGEGQGAQCGVSSGDASSLVPPAPFSGFPLQPLHSQDSPSGLGPRSAVSGVSPRTSGSSASFAAVFAPSASLSSVFSCFLNHGLVSLCSCSTCREAAGATLGMAIPPVPHVHCSSCSRCRQGSRSPRGSRGSAEVSPDADARLVEEAAEREAREGSATTQLAAAKAGETAETGDKSAERRQRERREERKESEDRKESEERKDRKEDEQEQVQEEEGGRSPGATRLGDGQREDEARTAIEGDRSNPASPGVHPPGNGPLPLLRRGRSPDGVSGTQGVENSSLVSCRAKPTSHESEATAHTPPLASRERDLREFLEREGTKIGMAIETKGISPAAVSPFFASPLARLSPSADLSPAKKARDRQRDSASRDRLSPSSPFQSAADSGFFSPAAVRQEDEATEERRVATGSVHSLLLSQSRSTSLPALASSDSKDSVCPFASPNPRETLEAENESSDAAFFSSPVDFLSPLASPVACRDRRDPPRPAGASDADKQAARGERSGRRADERRTRGPEGGEGEEGEKEVCMGEGERREDEVSLDRDGEKCGIRDLFETALQSGEKPADEGLRKETGDTEGSSRVSEILARAVAAAVFAALPSKGPEGKRVSQEGAGEADATRADNEDGKKREERKEKKEKKEHEVREKARAERTGGERPSCTEELEVVGSETGVSVGGDMCLSPSLASALSSLPASSMLAKAEPVSSPPAALGPLHLPPSACSRFASASDLQVSPRLSVSSPSSPSASRLASPARALRGLAPETGDSRSLGSSLEPGGDSGVCCCPHSRSATRCCCYEISPPFFFTTTSASPFSSSFQPFVFPSQGSLLPLSLQTASSTESFERGGVSASGASAFSSPLFVPNAFVLSSPASSQVPLPNSASTHPASTPSSRLSSAGGLSRDGAEEDAGGKSFLTHLLLSSKKWKRISKFVSLQTRGPCTDMSNPSNFMPVEEARRVKEERKRQEKLRMHSEGRHRKSRSEKKHRRREEQRLFWQDQQREHQDSSDTENVHAETSPAGGREGVQKSRRMERRASIEK